MKKIRFILCGLLAFLIITMSIPIITEAAAEPVCQKATTLHYQYNASGTVTMESLYIGNLSRSAKVFGIRSSNKNIQAKVNGLCYNAIWIDRKKSSHRIKDGEKTTISFKVKQNGKTYKLSSRITFKRFDQVFKSFKIGNKEYASDFAGYWGTEAQIKGKTAKIRVAPAAGYKIDKIVAYYWHGGENYESKKIKNGSKIALKDLMYIYAYYHPVKTPVYFNVKNLKKPELSPFNYEFHIRTRQN